jgi:Xaa-Pro aminopeptidase
MRRFASVLALLATPLVASAQISLDEFAARRAKLLDATGDAVVVVLGERPPSPDYLPWAQRPDFRYLTGFPEPDAALVLVRRGTARSATLFVQPKDPAQEVWTGNRVGPAATKARFGVNGRVRSELDAALDSLIALGLPVLTSTGPRSAYGLKSLDEQWLDGVQSRHSAAKFASATAYIAQLRAFKSDAEVALIRRAVDISVVAHSDALRAAEPGMNEHEIQALVEYQFRRHGSERPAYASIVGSGPNATTLHYNTNDRTMNAGEMTVMDAGALFGGYASDITRSFPVNGKFSAEQRAIHEVVLAAQKAAERQIGPGRPASAMADSATAAMAAGLAKLGLIDSATATYDCGTRQCPQLSLFYMHGLGHGLGLEVHDPDQYYFDGDMGVNSVYTIEPGVYVRANLIDIIPDTPRNRVLKTRLAPLVQRYANVGVRIEDVFLVTRTGYVHLSKKLPREAAEIERLMAEPYTGPSPRLPEVIRQ